MDSIIEVSIYGDLYFFENTFTSSQLQDINEYIHKYFKNTHFTNHSNIQSLINSIKNDLNISLNLLPIKTVIAV